MEYCKRNKEGKIYDNNHEAKAKRYTACSQHPESMYAICFRTCYILENELESQYEFFGKSLVFHIQKLKFSLTLFLPMDPLSPLH